MLNTKLLLVIIALLSSIAGYEAYLYRQESDREQKIKQFWNKVDTDRQKNPASQANSPKAKDVLKYRVP